MKPLPLESASSILDCLNQYASAQPDARAYVFLLDGERDEGVLTYGELKRRAIRFAAMLQQRGLEHKVALLLYPSGLEFVVAFFGCLYAGTVAVPANLARNTHHYMRLQRIIVDSNAVAVLTLPSLLNTVKAGMGSTGADVAAVDYLSEPGDGADLEYRFREAKQDELAFLQYTSGSTGTPKGVMVTHGQLIANERAIQKCAQLPEYAVVAGWLPQFHDMGLIGTTLQPIALGGYYVFMQPLHYILKPSRWLEMMSRYRAHTTAVPNFALDMCVRLDPARVPPDLDLSSVQTIFCGSEPIDADTVERFNSRFAVYGLGPNAVKPCYGLAEATLIVSGGSVAEELRFLSISRERLSYSEVESALSAEDVQRVVCCGQVVPGHEAVIVDPATFAVRAEGELGEVWFKGPSAAAGYWRNEEATRTTFHAYTACGLGPFMRTGDIGFFHRGGLFISGRIKEMMIIRGRNYYPQDIEATIVSLLRPACDVTVSVFCPHEQHASGVGIMVELARKAKLEMGYDNAYRLIREALSQVHEVQVKDVFFVSYGGIPRTSSGKIQRNRCAQMYLSGQLDGLDTKLYSSRDRMQPNTAMAPTP